ncbi:MAG: hypothetical protein A3D13_03595 [Planctomycetes bacterium RIFCSPHIGHO2_02_FULL_40_12]|nr:MAG: hypothetical protein A3D13_03595 [Planctomycetes bacterium RIFCSPHIGHO2_02_FULL_40_12]
MEVPNPDKLEITNYKRQITNKPQIQINEIQPRSFTKCAGGDLSYACLCVSACLHVTCLPRCGAGRQVAQAGTQTGNLIV